MIQIFKALFAAIIVAWSICSPVHAQVTNVPCNQLPALTGDTTTTGGSCATVTTKTNGVAFGNYAKLSAGQLTNSLGADVLLNNTANYFAGPTVAQGTTGTWFASGTVTLTNTAAGAFISCKLWDGTTVIASGVPFVSSANATTTGALSGFLASPAGNIRIDCKDAGTTTSKILFNQSGNSKDSTLSVFRIN